MDNDGRLEPPPGIPLTLVITGTTTAAAEDDVALRPLFALTPVPVLAAPLLSADPRGLGSVPGLKNKKQSSSMGDNYSHIATDSFREVQGDTGGRGPGWGWL